jgi:hypothetical protein
MLRARDYFSIDKPTGKLICKVLISGNVADGDAKYCNREFSDNNNTSSMNTHLRTFHKDMNDKNKENTVTPITIKNALLSKNAYDIESDKYKHITDHVVNFKAETNQQLSVVDHPAFIKLLSKLDDKYKLPGRLTITTKYLKEKVN